MIIIIIIIIISSSSSNSSSNGTSMDISVIIIMISSTASLIINSISLVIMLGLTHSTLTLNLLNKSFSLLFNFGPKLLRHVFKISRFSNPDPRVEILKHIAYENQGAIFFFESRPWNSIFGKSVYGNWP